MTTLDSSRKPKSPQPRPFMQIRTALITLIAILLSCGAGVGAAAAVLGVGQSPWLALIAGACAGSAALVPSIKALHDLIE